MNNMLKSITLVFCLVAGGLTANGQSAVLSLETCYQLARENYPLIQQRDLISMSSAYTIENVKKGYLPRVNINGQATYQSDVTQFPSQLPGVSVLSKDQYRIYAELNQPIYEGGIIRQQKKLQQAGALVAQQEVEVALYQLKERVNQVFFGILLLEGQLKQTELLQSDIQSGIHKAQGAVDNGAAFKSSLDLLKAESLKVRQRSSELQSNKKAFTEMLGLLTGQALSENTKLEVPVAAALGTEINRPELLLFDYQRQTLGVQNQLLKAKNRPKLSFFFQGGIGRPAFNILSNDFEPYYIGGFRLNVPLSGYYTLKNERNIVSLNQHLLDIQKETFRFNTNFALLQQNAEVTKLLELIQTDEEIIKLRASVKKAAAAQLENGVITSSDYLREVNAEDAALQTKILHNIQLLLAQYTQKATSGN